MNIVALMTARGGSKSVPNKNIVPIKGLPLFLHNIINAKRSRYIEEIYVTTDIQLIKDYASVYGYHVIDRPAHLCGDEASHYETIMHGIRSIEQQKNIKIDIVVILLGNSLGAITKDVDQAIEMLLENEEADSVQSVSEFNMYNPFRAYEIVDGYMNTIVPQEMIRMKTKDPNVNSRHAAGNVYFFNGSFWIVRRHQMDRNDGLLPFPWLGKKIIPYIQDNFMEIDAPWQLSYIENREWGIETIGKFL